jgi:hypothetical protein
MTSPTVQLRRRRRLLALATAGLALCIGVSVTSLAAWQQNIQVTPGTGSNGIGSSLLKIEISLDGGTHWNAATVDTNGRLAFSTNSALLTPGDTIYASVLLRAARGSRGADVKLSGGAVSDTLITALRYAARTGVLSAQCNKTTLPTLTDFMNAGNPLVGLDSVLSSGSGGTTFAVPAAPADTEGTAVGVCLAVTLPSGVPATLGGLTTSPVWQFDATSN